MANSLACIEAIRAASGREDLSDDEIDRIVEGVQLRIKRKIGDGVPAAEAARQTSVEFAQEATLKSLIEQRSAAENIIKRQALNQRTIAGQEYNSQRSTLSGIVRSTDRDFGRSVDADRLGRTKELLGPMVAKLDKAGLLDVMKHRDKAFDKDVAVEMARVSDPSIAGTGNTHAEAAAKILAEAVENGRLMMNEAGGWISKLDGYIVRQSHDQLKIAKMGMQSWKDLIKPLLSDETFADKADADDYLTDVYHALSTGVHDTASSDGPLAAFTGPQNLAKKVSQERSLVFKDPQSWFDYNTKAGKGGVVDAVAVSLERAARDSALMEAFGTNPKAMFDKWTTDLIHQAKGEPKMIAKLRSEDNQQLFKVITGEANIPDKLWLAQVGQNLRNLQQLSRLGAVVIRSIPDLVVTSATLRKNGVGLFEGIGNQVSSIVAQGLGSAERRNMAQMLGVGIDGTIGHVVNRFRAPDGLPGTMARTVDTFHRFTGLTYWTDAMKSGMGLMLSHNIARNAGSEFERLDPFLQQNLKRYGIEASEWEGIRSTKARAADGRDYVMPGDIQDKQLGRKLQAMFSQEILAGMSEPSANIRRLTTQYGPPGSWRGEIARAMFQFKSFSLSFMEQTAAREVGRGGLDLPGSIYLIAGLTAMGYASNTLSDLINLKSPVQPSKDQAGPFVGYAKNIFNAFLAGGAGGLYADVLMRPGDQSILDRLGGPIPSTLDDFRKAYFNVAAGSNKRERQQIAGSELAKFLHTNTPFIGYPLGLKQFVDFQLYYRFQEMVNPGFIQRLEKRTRDNNQQYILSPNPNARR